MYLLLSKNNPYLDELNATPQGQNIQKEFDGLEIDLKNRFKSNNLDLKDNILLNHKNLSENNSLDDNTSKTDSLTFISSKLQSSQIEMNEEELESKKNDNKKHIKLYINILNIVSSIIILISIIISQVENDNYFFENKNIRKIGALIVNLFDFSEDFKFKAWDNLFIDESVNLNLLLEPKGNILPTLISYYINHNFTYNKLNNMDILQIYNFTLDTFDLLNVCSYKKIKIPLKISDSNNRLRYIILSLTLISILFISASRYLSFYREKKILEDNPTPFYKSKYCLILFIEVIFLLLLPYPSLNKILIINQLDRIMILPLSSFLSSILTFRSLYFLQLFNSFSIYNSLLSEKILDKFYLSPNLIFTIKAYQKSNPFIYLTLLFTISCITFSLSIRIYEMHYWETITLIQQDWTSIYNSIWCIFVSMTTVGYGDFYPKTHFGRIIIIFSCVIGIYFISMMMIFLTQKSILSESEMKSYKLITRIKIRNQLKDIHSYLIYCGIKMKNIKNSFKKEIINQKEYDIKFNYEKRRVINLIDERKMLIEKIKSFDIIPTKDQLYDITERIDIDIKNIFDEVKILQKLNSSFLIYTDSQVGMIKYLKKCIQNTKLMLDLIDKKPKDFGELSKFNKKNLNEKIEKISREHKNESINMDNMNLNKDLQIDTLFEDFNLNYNNNNYDEFFSKELSKYKVSKDEYKQYFFPLFFHDSNNINQKSKVRPLRTVKTIKQMKEMKRKINNDYKQKRNKSSLLINDDE